MITPADIENRVFKKVKIGGYDIKDVEEFLEELIVDYEAIFKKVAELNDKCDNLQESVTYYKSIENGLERTLENAREESEEMKEKARKEIEELKDRQEEILNEELKDLKEEIRRKNEEIEDVKKQIQIYKIKTKSMLEAQLKILDEYEE